MAEREHLDDRTLVARILEGDRDRFTELVKRYEKRINRAMNYYLEMVEGYYTQPFLELFMEPREKFSLPAAITAVLAGELEGGWTMWWRRKVFFWLVKVQSLFPLVPRICWRRLNEPLDSARHSNHPRT